MKKLAISAKALSIAAIAAVTLSCSSTSTDEKPAAAAAAGEKSETAAALPNFRYIDSDSVSAQYNLAKDFQDAALRAMSRIENARQSKAAEIQKLASQIEQKARSNGYLTPESYNGDMARLQKMQQDAETYMANLQRNTETELASQQQTLNDSIEAFIKVYNADKGYDAILFKAAGVYFNPALDITKEVVDGLNARYKKAESK